MSEIELTIFNTSGRSEGINAINLTRGNADSVFKLLVELGASRDIRFMYNESAQHVDIMKRVYTPCDFDEEGNQVINAERMYSLYDYIKLLIRFDRSAHKRMKNVKDKINQMHQAITRLEKQC